MRLTHTIAALLLVAGPAYAQTSTQTAPAAMAPAAGAQTPAATINQTPQTTTSPSPSAVQTNNAMSRTAAAPVAGRNSFTESEATRRIAAAGYSDVTALKKDGQGIWRGQAKKDGSPISVALDYQGNVVGQ